MGLLTDLREFLLKVRERKISLLPDPSFVDLGTLRRRLFDAARSTDTWQEKHLLLTSGEALIVEIAIDLQSDLNLSDPGRLAALLPTALDHVLSEYYGLDRPSAAPGIERIEEILVHRASDSAWRTWVGRNEERSPMAPRYASELAMVQAPRGRLELQSAGDVFLRLSGPDATRWVLALELLASLDPEDSWRGHLSIASLLLTKRSIAYYDDEARIPPFRVPWPWNTPTLDRWAALGILRVDELQEYDSGRSATLTDLGAEILGELLQDQDTPLKSLARATLEDTTAALVDAVTHPARGRTSAGIVRHTRMVAHELRNALVPVRFNYQRLWEQLPRDDVRVALRSRHEAILGGLDRALRFVTDAARAVDAAGDESTFEVAAALRDACVSVEESERTSIHIALPSDNHITLDGPRARFVMAIVNLLRNAAQAGGSSVQIRVTLARSSGHVVVVTVDDSGPGVPAERREQLFAVDAARTQDGRGHGLALVREVIEDEYGGSVHHEASELGGARFVLRLPAAKESV